RTSLSCSSSAGASGRDGVSGAGGAEGSPGGWPSPLAFSAAVGEGGASISSLSPEVRVGGEGSGAGPAVASNTIWHVGHLTVWPSSSSGTRNLRLQEGQSMMDAILKISRRLPRKCSPRIGQRGRQQPGQSAQPMMNGE